jgi:hypothetical protein
MFPRKSRILARTLPNVCMFVLAIVALSCTSESPTEPASAVESADVHCTECSKKVARESAEPHITPDGLDVYICKMCLSKPRKSKPRSSPPARTSNKSSSKGTT